TFTKLGGATFNQATIFEIVVQSSGNRLFVATNRGLYRSLDAGQSWKKVLAPGGADQLGDFVTHVVELPGTAHNGLLAAVGWRGGHPKNGLYVSNNDGDTWSKVNPVGFAPQGNIGRMTLAVHPDTPGLIYAVVQDAVLFNTGGATVLNGVYKTTAGPSGPWTLVATSQIYANDPNSALDPLKIGPGYQPGIQAWYNQYVEIDPLDANHVVVGLEEIYDTDDGGATWDTIGRYWNYCISSSQPNCNLNPNTHPTTHPDQHTAAFTEVNGVSKIFVGNDGGVWSQTGPTLDNDHWLNRNTNLSTIQFYYTEPSGGPNYVVYGGTQDNGHIKYEGNPTWPIVYGGDGGDAAVEPNNPNNAYEEYVYLTMAKTTDGGQTWTNIYTPDSGSSATARFISPFEMDPLSKNHIVALGRHVWETNIGISTQSDDWQNAYDLGAGHFGTALDLRGPTVYAGWCGPCNPSPPVDPNGNGFARGLATNVGGTWHAVAANGLPNRYVTGIAIDPANANHVFVTLSGFSRRWVPYAGNGSIFESTNGGQSFTSITKNLPDAPANDAILFNGRLIVATDVGVYERAGDGTWGLLGTGLPKVSVLDLALVPGQGTLIAGSHGRGAWAIQL
ncbi:MAG TPA: hypothetical protein VEO00_07925, partial [Actinomycetota bacterium]|nr:hypothetical protein [Actinomycetota bacterium]